MTKLNLVYRAPPPPVKVVIIGKLSAKCSTDDFGRVIEVTAPMGAGKLAREDLPVENYSQVMSYDTLGRTSSVTSTTNGEVLTQSTAYDSYGRISRITYPTGFAVNQVYNAYGYLSEVRNAANNALYWQANTVTADGQIDKETLGNNIITLRVFDVLGRVEGISSGIGTASDVQKLTYTYDSASNLLTRNDYNRANVTESFGYDQLNRVTTATLGGVPKNYGYDAIGNLTAKSDLGTYTYTGGTCGGGVHAVKSEVQTPDGVYARRGQFSPDGVSSRIVTFCKVGYIDRHGETPTD